ncbi:MAG TPA: GNAT family N-acetyltransferase [Abditibacterium sp.]|jgi:GNAT superfamily N-acetyltransferase
MNDLEFRLLNARVAERAYLIFCETVAWLREKNIQLWEKPIPRAVYFARQNRSENFGLFADAELAVIVSLTDVPDYWADCVAEADARWLCTLATANRFRGRGLGRHTVKMALAEQEQSALYLDCKPGFLEQFYEDLGFEALEKRELV